MRKNLLVAFVFNLIIVILETIGIILSLQKTGILTFTFYTTDSNFLALFTSLVFCIFYLTRPPQNKIPSWLQTFRFISCVSLGVTIFISICVIIPLYPNLLEYMLLENFGLYFHLICPLLSIISFLFFEKNKPLAKRTIILTLAPTILFGIINISLNLSKIITGPYPFFYLFIVPWYTSLFTIFFILLSSLVISIFIYKIYNKKTNF